MQTVDKLLALHQSHPHVWQLKGECCLQLNQDDKALEWFETAFKLKPNSFNTLEQLIRLYFTRQRINKVIKLAHHLSSMGISTVELADVSLDDD